MMFSFVFALALAAPLHLADLLREARDKNPDLKSAQDTSPDSPP